MQGLDATAQLQAVHAGHVEIRQHDVGIMVPVHLQGRNPIGGLQQVVAFRFQYRPGDGLENGIIVRDQDAHGAAYSMISNSFPNWTTLMMAMTLGLGLSSTTLMPLASAFSRSSSSMPKELESM